MLDNINNIADQSNNYQALRGYIQKLDNLKKITENPHRNLEGFTSLTLKSEFSQDVSDFFFENAFPDPLNTCDLSGDSSMIKEEGNSKEILNNFNIKSIEIVNKMHKESIDDVICNIVKTEENKFSKKESLLSQYQESISPWKKPQLIEMKSAKKTSKKIIQVSKGDINNTFKKTFNNNGIRYGIIQTEKSNHDNILKISQEKSKFESECSFPIMAGLIQKDEKKIHINETMGKKQLNTETIYNKIKDENMILKSKKKKKTGNLRRINSNSIHRFLGRSVSTTSKSV